jgi:hypothetical protein
MPAKNEAFVNSANEAGRTGAPNGGKRSSRGLWIGLGAGCALLVLLVACSSGAIALWVWAKPAIEEGAQKKITDAAHDANLPNPVKGTGSLGKAPLTELDPPTAVWDFTLRLPKGLVVTIDNQRTAEPPNLIYSYQWANSNRQSLGRALMNVGKWPTTETDPMPRLVSGRQKFKSDPGDQIRWDTIHMPQAVEINGLTGARSWTVYPDKYPDRAEIIVNYYFVVDGWGYLFNCYAFGKTEAEARQNAEVVDVSICTFRKR